MSRLEAIVPTVAGLIGLFRAQRLAGRSTRARRTSPTSPTARRPSARAATPTLRIGDAGPMGRLLVRGEPGNQIVAALAPIAGEIVIDKPGKGMF